MKIAKFQSLLPSVACIQPHLAWLSACIPSLIPAERRPQVQGILDDLTLKFIRLTGRALDLEGSPIEVDDTCILSLKDGNLGVVEGPAVVLVDTANPTAADWAASEAVLRSALAQVIVSRGEAELAAVGEKIEEIDDAKGCNGCPCTGQCSDVDDTDDKAPQNEATQGIPDNFDGLSTNDFRADGRPDPGMTGTSRRTSN